MNTIRELIYPELQAIEPMRRPHALRRAREAPLDALELLGMAAALVLATALTRYGIAGLDMGERLFAAVANFVIALPVLAVCVAPFLVRRTRRALRSELEGRARS